MLAGAAAIGAIAGYVGHRLISQPSETDYVFSSESVCEGHPDKLCDQISDAIVDACIRAEPNSKVACNISAKGTKIYVYGEITTSPTMNNTIYEEIVRGVIKKVGYDHVDKGLDYKTCDVVINLMQQSAEIAASVHVGKKKEDIGAGDQGMMFGYACDETEELMPLTCFLAQRLCETMHICRMNGTIKGLRPDGKSQVTIDYKKIGGHLRPVRVNAIVLSCQHDPIIYDGEKQADLHAELHKHVISKVVPAHMLDANTKYFMNPSKRFVIGGPCGDSGLTGRKIIVDTYGGGGAHGGGAFSGKDPTKVDRSGAYIARQAAKSLVAAGLCSRVLVQLAYAIGVPEPMNVCVDTYGTGKFPDAKLEEILNNNFDFRVGFLIDNLNLKQPIYQQSATYGHFGRKPDLATGAFSWEVVKPLKY
jgi:S-adenosylmethionine synthetase